MAKGGGRACAFAREEAAPSIAGAWSPAQESFILHPDQLAEQALQEWASVWGADCPRGGSTFAEATAGAFQAPTAGLGGEALGPIDIGDLRRAIRRGGKGCGVDHWSREEMLALPDIALEALALVLRRIEEEGAFPSAARGIVEVLMTKGQGLALLDQRLIGILARTYRVWAALRQAPVRTWRAHRLGGWAWGAGPGRGAEDAAVLSTAVAEHAALVGQACGEVLFDCTKCYETVGLEAAALAAARHQFPGRIARIALAQYAGPRTIAIAGANSGWVATKSGLVAGCGHAVHLLQTVMIDPAERI